MKPGFALFLSFDGISLLHRAAGGWRLVGEVAVDSADLTAGLAALKARALLLEPDGITCKLILPNDQIRYLSIDTGDLADEARDTMVRKALDGATPYSVDELVFDISVEGATTHVAAVARETLSEAETFAVEHGFNAVSFVAIPGEMPFLGEPYFGTTRLADTGKFGAVESDGVAVVIIGPAQIPAPAKPDEPAAAPKPIPGAEPVAKVAPEDRAGPATDSPPAPAPAPSAIAAAPAPTAPAVAPAPSAAATDVGFTTRRAKTDAPTTAPVLPGNTRASPARPGGDNAPKAKKTPPPAPAPRPAPAKAIPVTAPVLDVPDMARHPDDSSAPPAAAPPPSGIRSFLTRRKPPKADKPASPGAAPGPRAAVAHAAVEAPADETSRMTIFGARQPTQPVRGKPRFLGLILTGLLVLFLVLVAIWASVFTDTGLSGLFDRSGGETELASEPAPEPSPPATADTAQQVEAPDTVQLAETPPPIAPDDLADSPVAPALSDTDAAVLDAMRAIPDTEDVPQIDEAEQAGIGNGDEARYAATGIWQTAPQEPQTPSIMGLDDLYIASIDRTDLSQDAVALPPAPDFGTDLPAVAVPSPSAPDTAFALDSRGLVTPTVEGAMSPDGHLVYLGHPKLVPPPTPTRFETEPEVEALRERVADRRPRLRPTDLVEQTERTQLGGLTRDELGGLRPKLRPRTEKQVAEEDETPTAQAVVVSRKPSARPKGFEDMVAKIAANVVRDAATATAAASAGRTSTDEADDEPEQVAAAPAPRTVAPSIPSSASVARQATLDNAINLRRVNLIGVYGTASNRRALVRLPGGSYKKVKVGDTIDGGRVVAIGDSELRYQKGGRSHTLTIPSG